MMRKVILIGDPGIDGAFAASLALLDPDLEVLGYAATGGNISAEQATTNVQIVVEQVDPPRWPRLGAALPVDYGVDGARLHGPNGLGGVEFPCAQLHHLHPSDKLVIDLVRQNPGETTIINLGPLTVLARAFDRDPDLPSLVQRLVCVGGTWREPGNASAVAEFHFFCDPLSARQVLRSGVHCTLIPLDVTRKLILAPGDLLEVPCPESSVCRFLKKIIPYGIRMTSNLYGIEGLHLKDVLGVAAVAMPAALSTKPMPADVETRGELTRGMLVIDARPGPRESANVDLAEGIDVAQVRKYIDRVLGQAAK